MTTLHVNSAIELDQVLRGIAHPEFVQSRHYHRAVWKQY